MLFTISTGSLQKQLQLLNGAVGANAVLPILNDFLFELNGPQLTISASDQETTMITEVEVMGSQDGAVAIPAKLLNDVLKSLPEQPITFSIDTYSYAVELRTQNGMYKIAGENPGSFPEMTTPDKSNTLTLNSDVLANATEKTLFAVGTDQLRPAMTGVFCNFDENGATFVATDAHKLVKYEHYGQQFTTAVQFILPKKALTLLKNALPAKQTIVHLTYNKTNALFRFENIQLSCLLVEGRYPDYTVVIPKDNDNVVTINRTDLLASLKRALIFSNKSTFEVVLSISENELKINTQDLDFYSEAHESISCDYQGNAMDIAFNARFLVELLSSMDVADILLELSVPHRAALILPAEQAENENLLMLIMPIMRYS
ncbi:DNA polymerase III subunit beta [Sphingobacteriales bacterium UPWRP_1]|nr:DNA polymerase III subunit beta [Sphingobacteriales bacterium TSM_CSM]PSJ77907.1 DNA polymerase III subunit beta [Sphingobacteriales bacterium UPWRP_1]